MSRLSLQQLTRHLCRGAARAPRTMSAASPNITPIRLYNATFASHFEAGSIGRVGVGELGHDLILLLLG